MKLLVGSNVSKVKKKQVKWKKNLDVPFGSTAVACFNHALTSGAVVQCSRYTVMSDPCRFVPRVFSNIIFFRSQNIAIFHSLAVCTCWVSKYYGFATQGCK